MSQRIGFAIDWKLTSMERSKGNRMKVSDLMTVLDTVYRSGNHRLMVDIKGKLFNVSQALVDYNGEHLIVLTLSDPSPDSGDQLLESALSWAAKKEEHSEGFKLYSDGYGYVGEGRIWNGEHSLDFMSYDLIRDYDPGCTRCQSEHPDCCFNKTDCH